MIESRTNTKPEPATVGNVSPSVVSITTSETKNLNFFKGKSAFFPYTKFCVATARI